MVLGDFGWSRGAVFSDLSTGAVFAKVKPERAKSANELKTVKALAEPII